MEPIWDIAEGGGGGGGDIDDSTAPTSECDNDGAGIGEGAARAIAFPGASGWASKWRRKPDLWLKVRLHMSHRYGLIPVNSGKSRLTINITSWIIWMTYPYDYFHGRLEIVCE